MRPNLASLVDDWRKRGSDIAAVTYSGNRSTAISYSALAQLAARFAAELERRGIGSGDRVVVWGRNSAEWIAAFFGCILRGALVVPLDAAGSLDFARRVLHEVQPKLITGNDDLLRSFSGETSRLSFETLPSQLPASPSATAAAPNLTRESPLQILFTSGTTSDPKGIVHTHGNVLASLDPLEKEFAKYRLYRAPFHPLRFLHALPLSHVFGQFMGLWLPPLLGAEVHFESRLEADRLLWIIQRRCITLLAAVPRVLDLMRIHLLQLDSVLPQRFAAAQKLPWWKRFWYFRDVHRRFGFRFWAFICGGAALPEDLERFWGMLGFAVVQGYGMTETAALITLNHPFKAARGSIGKPLPGRELRIGADGEVMVRGEMVSTSTWQQGQIQTRTDPWLATGDLVSVDDEGKLRFVGRKSEVIVTPAGLNIHPEDVEAELMRQPGIAACALVAEPLPQGGQLPIAVLLAPGGSQTAESAVLAANQNLAEFQRILRWYLWPGADLPRTSTGKVQRRKVAEWVLQQSSANTSQPESTTSEDSLLALLTSITGESISHASDASRLQEDLHIDSLGRLQLQSTIEQRFGVALDDDAFLQARTLGDLRAMLRQPAAIVEAPASPAPSEAAPTSPEPSAAPQAASAPAAPIQPKNFLYPRWPWLQPIAALRNLFLEWIADPIVWLLLNPRIRTPRADALPSEPMLLIANHATSFDVPLILYGLPPHIRRRTAVASAGEMLEDWRHGRNQPYWWQNLLGPLQYWLLTALFNIFPLPRQAGFRRSFAHIGEALDHGYNVLIFPEGRRADDGKLQPFRSGIGALAQESQAPVLPVALKGMDALVGQRKHWFHAGLVEVRVGKPITVDSTQRSQETATHLHDEIEKMLS